MRRFACQELISQRAQGLAVPTVHSRMQGWWARKVLLSGAHSRDPVTLHTPAVQPRDDARSAPASTSAGKTSTIGGLAQRVRAKRDGLSPCKTHRMPQLSEARGCAG
jgi:hypothetical protein